MSYWTGPCCLCSHFLQKNGGKGCHAGQDLVFFNSYSLQKNGGEGCHPGQDLVLFTLVSYKRMEEKDVIVDRTLSISGTDLFYFLLIVRKATR